MSGSGYRFDSDAWRARVFSAARARANPRAPLVSLCRPRAFLARRRWSPECRAGARCSARRTRHPRTPSDCFSWRRWYARLAKRADASITKLRIRHRLGASFRLQRSRRGVRLGAARREERGDRSDRLGRALHGDLARGTVHEVVAGDQVEAGVIGVARPRLRNLRARQAEPKARVVLATAASATAASARSALAFCARASRR